MFKNIGKKIKELAVLTFVFGLIISFVIAFSFYRFYGIDTAIILFIVGFLLSWVSVFTLYGFGHLICQVDKLVDEKEGKLVNANKDRSSHNAISTCPKCGAICFDTDVFCQQCGCNLNKK